MIPRGPGIAFIVRSYLFSCFVLMVLFCWHMVRSNTNNLKTDLFES